VLRSLWLVVLVAACGKHGAKDPAPCEAVGAKVRTVARAELDAVKDLPDATRHDAELQLGPLEGAVARTCRDQHWPDAVRGCMVGASTGAALQTCASSLTAEQRGALPPAKAAP